MSYVLKRVDVVAGRLDGTIARLDQVTAELHATNETMRLMVQQHQVVLDVLVRQTNTNAAIMRRLENHGNRINDLENPDSGKAA